VRDVCEAQLREADLDFAIEPATFGPSLEAFLDGIRYQATLGDPRYELFIILYVLNHSKEVLLRVGQHLTC